LLVEQNGRRLVQPSRRPAGTRAKHDMKASSRAYGKDGRYKSPKTLGRSCSGWGHVLDQDWLDIEIFVNIKVL
jgi:hypothetical protein